MSESAHCSLIHVIQGTAGTF